MYRLALWGLLVFFSMGANASLITVNFVGNIARVQDPLAERAPFAAGDTATASLTYDSSLSGEAGDTFANAVADFQVNLGNGAIWEYDPTVTAQTVNLAWPRFGYFVVWNPDYSGTSGSITAPEYQRPPDSELFTGSVEWTSDIVPWQAVFFFEEPSDTSAVPINPTFTDLRVDYVLQSRLESGGLSSRQIGVNVTWDQVTFEGDESSQIPIPGTIGLLAVGLLLLRRRLI